MVSSNSVSPNDPDQHENSATQQTDSAVDRSELEATLQRTEAELEQYRTLYESIPSIYFTLNSAGIVLSVNALGAEQLGYAPQELTKKPIFDLFHPQDQANLQTALTAFLRSPELSRSWEVRARCKDCSLVWLKVTAHSVSGEPDFVVLNCEDISEQKQGKQWRERFFALSLDLLCITGFDGYFKHVNPMWEEVLGFTRAELLSRPFIEFVHPEDKAATEAEMQRLIAGDTDTINFENRYRCRNGSYIWLSWRTKTSTREKVFYAVVRDITHQKQIEAALKQSNDRAVRILESITDAFYALDHQWRFTYLNAEAELLLQKSRENLIGKFMWDEFPQSADSICYLKYHKAVSEQVAVEYEELYPPTNRWFVVHVYPSDGGLAVYFHDITERKQIEATLRQNEQVATAQVEEMERLSHLKDEFLSTVSHELRSPMTNIKMAVQMLDISFQQQVVIGSDALALAAERSKTARYLQILKKQCEQEINLINDLLDLQRLEAGSQPLALETIDLGPWLRQSVEPFRERLRSQEQTLQLDLPSVLPRLQTDAASLGRILAELLNNACKYTPSGAQIALSAQVCLGKIQLQVSNASEIPESEFPHIFTKFYRILSRDPWRQQGTGLGLSLVKKLTEHLGGTVWVKSAANYTCFTVELPLDR